MVTLREAHRCWAQFGCGLLGLRCSFGAEGRRGLMAGWGLGQSGGMAARHMVFLAHVIALGFKFESFVDSLFTTCVCLIIYVMNCMPLLFV